MSREIAPAPQVLITSPNPYHLAELVKRESARSSIVVRGAIGEVEPGLWGVHVYQVAPLERRWLKPLAVTTGVVVGLGTFGWVAWMAVAAAQALAAGISVATLLGLVLVAGVVLRLTRAGGGTSVDVHVRVRR